jgi:hypothetical protein
MRETVIRLRLTPAYIRFRRGKSARRVRDAIS